MQSLALIPANHWGATAAGNRYQYSPQTQPICSQPTSRVPTRGRA